jgi:hypothetical protein
MLTSLEGNNYLTDSCIDDNSSTLFLKAKKKKTHIFPMETRGTPLI